MDSNVSSAPGGLDVAQYAWRERMTAAISLRPMVIICLLGLVWACAAGCGATSVRDTQQPSAPLASASHTLYSDSASPTSQPSGLSGELITYPPAFLAYQQYLDVIGGRSRRPGRAVIEATVLSVHEDSVCPYQVETCPVEPYPKDVGSVRIDAVLRAPAAGADDLGTIREQAAVENAPQLDETGRQSTASNPGAQVEPARKQPPSLAPGQTVEAIFLLTARPATVRPVPAIVPTARQPGQPAAETTADAANRPPEPRTQTPVPLIMEDGRYVFVTDVTYDGASVDMPLPGLKPGDRFRAEVGFDGRLYIRTYTVLP